MLVLQYISNRKKSIQRFIFLGKKNKNKKCFSKEIGPLLNVYTYYVCTYCIDKVSRGETFFRLIDPIIDLSALLYSTIWPFHWIFHSEKSDTVRTQILNIRKIRSFHMNRIKNGHYAINRSLFEYVHKYITQITKPQFRFNITHTHSILR